MTIVTISTYIIFSLILFFLLNYLSKYNENKEINRIVISLIYIVLLSGLIKDNSFIFLILIFEFLIRLFYTNYVEEKDFFKENTSILKEYILTFFLGYLLNAYFINKTDTIFLTVSEFRIILWLFIIVFLYTYINNSIKVKNVKKENTINKINKEYILISYAKIKNEYSEIIKTKNKLLIDLTYSILIYNNSKKSKIDRKIDLIKFRIDNVPRPLGIMQITTKKQITDEESINIGIKKLERIYLKHTKDKKLKDQELLILIINDYLKEDKDIKNILDIYNKITEFNKK